MINIGDAIRKKRNYLGYSQHYLAIHADISQPKLSRIESGFSTVTFEELLRIAGCLDLTLDQLGISFTKKIPVDIDSKRLHMLEVENGFLRNRLIQLESTLLLYKETNEQLLEAMKNNISNKT